MLETATLGVDALEVRTYRVGEHGAVQDEADEGDESNQADDDVEGHLHICRGAVYNFSVMCREADLVEDEANQAKKEDECPQRPSQGASVLDCDVLLEGDDELGLSAHDGRRCHDAQECPRAL